jgi:hypothetical protein
MAIPGVVEATFISKVTLYFSPLTHFDVIDIKMFVDKVLSNQHAWTIFGESAPEDKALSTPVCATIFHVAVLLTLHKLTHR